MRDLNMKRVKKNANDEKLKLECLANRKKMLAVSQEVSDYINDRCGAHFTLMLNSMTPVERALLEESISCPLAFTMFLTGYRSGFADGNRDKEVKL